MTLYKRAKHYTISIASGYCITVLLCAKTKNSDNWAVNDSLCSRFDNDAYIYEDPKPIKLGVGKFYRTMNGSKVVVAYINTDFPDKYPVCVVIIGNTKMYWVGIDGSRGTDISRASDLVAPWEE